MTKRSQYARENQLLIAILLELRTNIGMTQVELAKRTGLLQSEVSRVENGRRQVDYFELRRWLAALNLDIGTFDAELSERLERVGITSPLKSK
ncbi:helix-turn-helix domain-containing protein [Variovorax sp. E3]|uniref:helix-turn-helix domain-containing protein n=1 Tax=Variovorax sp. E3 TaxID=1914993 RepID=UPI0018DD8569|nr:helix-turn-helix transcriptional regulator [Variovorax sp. E3]